MTPAQAVRQRGGARDRVHPDGDLPLPDPEISALNPWTRRVDRDLILHPDAPGQGPATMRFRGLQLGGRSVFEATLRTPNERCRPVRVRLEVRDRSTGEPVASDEVEVSGKFTRKWRIGLQAPPEEADVILSCRLSPRARDNRFSGVRVERPRFQERAGDAVADGAPSVGLLFDGRFDEFFRTQADGPDCLWVLHHIPKTAGTSILNEVSKAMRPSANVFGVKANGRPGVEQALNEHLPAIAAGEYRFATGHFYRPHIETIMAQPPATRPITFLRHPVSRYVSQYRYTLTPKHPHYKKVRKRWPTLESYLEYEGARDVMFARLRKTPEDSVEDVIADVEASYAFIGITERYQLSRRALFRLLGQTPPKEMVVKNRTEPIAANEVDWRLFMGRIRELNAKDLQLYQYFCERFMGIESELERFLDRSTRNP